DQPGRSAPHAGVRRRIPPRPRRGRVVRRSVPCLPGTRGADPHGAAATCACRGRGVMFALTGKTAPVPGGSRGLGRAIALAFATQGADVAINYRGNAEAADEVAAAIT